MPDFNDEERLANESLLDAVSRIQGWGLKANHAELVQATHVIQGFIVQHMLQRLNPDAFGRWYEEHHADY